MSSSSSEEELELGSSKQDTKANEGKQSTPKPAKIESDSSSEDELLSASTSKPKTSKNTDKVEEKKAQPPLSSSSSSEDELLTAPPIAKPKNQSKTIDSGDDEPKKDDSEKKNNDTAIATKATGKDKEKKEDSDSSSSDEGQQGGNYLFDSDDEDRLEEPMKPKDLILPKLDRPDAKSDIRYVKVPNFLHICPYAFDEDKFSEEHEKSEMKDSGKGILDSVIRWRFKKDVLKNKVIGDDGKPVIESNARFVEWSDGSVQLLIGNQAFDVKKENAKTQFLFTSSKDSNSETSCLDSHGIMSSQLMFRPTGLKSSAHRDLAFKVKGRTLKGFKVKETESIKDPEALQEQRAKAKEERLRMQNRQRQKSKRNSYGRGDTWNAEYMEEGTRGGGYYDEDGEEEYSDTNDTSVKDIKNRYRKGATKRKSGVFSSDDSDSDDSDEATSSKPPTTRQRVIEDDDED
mmetsp:Transcript_5605/g.6428  ORF Transcript_5605/g.6428 Transcript_5605/m.6428 type:complete len:459 (-) Transcript_5605:28-1404(-)|eukprot:CAMPEP_0184007972 /NCGR_PEP_ID=MMETSP0954-20121128/1670_1 /TAXON_ID=627963 /ORGANISM="Aplanochytrium sp, Strain PBS07" /LENGTH=458 /DNA_ID=CAMNT_0026286941 /DNA_START=90 /DNA_END=1466 /DNA_ORIENTATION=+